MKLGRIVETNTRTMLGIISYEGKEVYSQYCCKKDEPVVFELEYIGPKKNIPRAINVFNYNSILEYIAMAKENKDTNRILKYIQVFKIFKDNNIKTKLSPLGKTGLNIVHQQNLLNI